KPSCRSEHLEGAPTCSRIGCMLAMPGDRLMNLFWKILLSFGLTIALTLVGAVIVSMRLAETSFEQGNIRGEEIVRQAREALDGGGRRGLVDWPENNDRPSSLLVMYVLG